MLTVTMLGVAATRPLPDRALSSAVFSVQGRHILLDCGEGTQTALHRHGVSPMKITLVALTHYHGDHILGLPGLLQTLDTMGRREPLYLTGPTEGHEAILAAIFTLADELSYPVSFLPMPQEGLSLHDLDARWPSGATLIAFPTQHRAPSQGYRLNVARSRKLDAAKLSALGVPKPLWRRLQQGDTITLGGQHILPDDVCFPARDGLSAVFCGDTAPCDSLLQAAKRADLLLMDATYPDDSHADKAALYGHTTFPQAAALAAEAGAGRLWLTHYSAMISDPEEHLAPLASIFAPTECAADGKTITLTFREREM